MREIKFRAWFKGKKYKVVAIDWQDDVIVSMHLKDKNEGVIKVYPEDDYGDKVVFEQYTNLKDKNGVEIYEGDIIRLCDGEESVVEFGKIGYDSSWNGMTGFSIKRRYNDFYEDGNGFYELWYHDDFNEIEVIGNIHEGE